MRIQTIINAALIGTPDPNVPPANTVSPIPRLVSGADGPVLDPDSATFETKLVERNGRSAPLDRVDLFNLLCVPGETTPATLSTLEKYCRDHRAFLIADCAENATLGDLQDGPDTNLTGDNAINAAFYFPWLLMPDPLQENRSEKRAPMRLYRRNLFPHRCQQRRLQGSCRNRCQPYRRSGCQRNTHGRRERRAESEGDQLHKELPSVRNRCLGSPNSSEAMTR